jgi:hypothetical protein
MVDGAVHLPDYTRASIVNLMSSIQQAFGVRSALYPPLAQLEPARLQEARNVVLIVVDGLGYDYLQQCGNGVLREHRVGRLTSVFPSTTASAITTFFTGAAPQQHALTGWFTYFKEIGSVLTPLPFRARYGGDGTGVDAHRLFHEPPFSEKINARCYVVLPQRIVDSDYTLVHSGSAERRSYVSLDQCFQCILDLLRTNHERKYIYAYWPDFDTLAHSDGVGSERVARHFAELEASFEQFFSALDTSATAVIVTADHGFIDSEPQKLIRMEDHQELLETLMLPLCGEPRAVFCYIHPEKCEQFEGYVREHFAASATLSRSADLIERGYFGLGEPHPRLLDRIGHYTLVMKDNYVLKDWVLGERPYVHIGVHGGVSEQEMYVPLIVFET